MKNFVNDGQTLDYAHNADVVSGQLLPVGCQVLVASKAAAANEKIAWARKGVFNLTCQAGTYNPGTRVSYDASAGKIAASAAVLAAGDFYCGVFMGSTQVVLAADGQLPIAINEPAPAIT